MLGDMEAIVTTSGHHKISEGQHSYRYDQRFEIQNTGEETS